MLLAAMAHSDIAAKLNALVGTVKEKTQRNRLGYKLSTVRFLKTHIKKLKILANVYIEGASVSERKH